MALVLVVEDFDDARAAIEKLLHLAGHSTIPAVNGLEAIQALETQTPDLVLLDLHMPVMDGIEFLENIRLNELWEKLPVIVVSATMDDGNLARAKELGAKACFVKARLSFDELLDRVQAHAAGPH